ncbi:hypothetical protein N7539_000282 [Penicillium diatomitis]|uniref:Uncharacterized protein n=1 Tax=Penicillium diatomitis TaxID=2819901 RepID=A0A9W9XLG6_9EURO|nr:uncharacterized protein N7539_000282 [Penicillium diatomitis]KAJ5495166.1 hypothetical protein N7539_000282 [Penicillium diatomitis]
MAFALFSPPSTILRLGLGLGIGLSAATLYPQSPFRAAPLRCDWPSSGSGSASRPTAAEINFTGRSSSSTEAGIATQAKNALLTPENMRQISLGSVLGLVAGVGLRAFSKVLVVVLGMGVVLVEWAASKGYNIVPLERVTGFIKNTNVRRMVNENRPFKISFGAMMAMAAFAQF